MFSTKEGHQFQDALPAPLALQAPEPQGAADL